MARRPQRAKQEPRVIQPEDLRGLADDILLMEAYCKAGRAFLSQQLAQGVKVPGVSLEPTTGSRTWNQDKLGSDPIKEILKVCKTKRLGLQLDDLAPRTMLSVAQMEAEVGKGKFAEIFVDYVNQPQATGNYSLKLGSAPSARKSILDRFKNEKER